MILLKEIKDSSKKELPVDLFVEQLSQDFDNSPTPTGQLVQDGVDGMIYFFSRFAQDMQDLGKALKAEREKKAKNLGYIIPPGPSEQMLGSIRSYVVDDLIEQLKAKEFQEADRTLDIINTYVSAWGSSGRRDSSTDKMRAIAANNFHNLAVNHNIFVRVVSAPYLQMIESAEASHVQEERPAPLKRTAGAGLSSYAVG